MNHGAMEFGDVAISFAGTECDSGRAENISRLTFEYVQQLLERSLQQIGADVEINRLEVPAILVSFETMSDEAIARASADRIYHALMQAV